MSLPDYDFLIKLLLIGDSGVGKSGLLLRFCDDAWPSWLPQTIGIDFKVRNIELDGKRLKLQIVRAHYGVMLRGSRTDRHPRAGTERFRSITTSYYRGAMGILLVYDVTDEYSFSNIRRWYSSVKAYASEAVNTILVGSKCYEDKRVVTTERGQALADELGIQFFETSAKLNVGVEDAFFTIARDITNRLIDSQPRPQPDNTANLGTESDFVYVPRPVNYKFA